MLYAFCFVFGSDVNGVWGMAVSRNIKIKSLCDAAVAVKEKGRMLELDP